MKSVQRDGLDYEFTIVYDLDIKQQAIGSKDRTSLFINKPPVVLSEKEGKIIRDWCNQGEDVMSEIQRFSEKIQSATSVVELRNLWRDNHEFRDSHDIEFKKRKKELVVLEQAKIKYNNLNLPKNGTSINFIYT